MPEKMARYRRTARLRQQEARAAQVQRRQQAWKAARRAAKVLKEQFGATRVVVFGSLVQEDCFTRWSDVDIAAWGIQPEDTFSAMDAADLADDEIEVSLADVETCRPELMAAIEREGVEL